MRAIVFDAPGRPLRAIEREIPEPAQGQLLLRVHACGICRTDLHLLDGEVQIAQPPRVLGHQIVASVQDAGPARDAQAEQAEGRIGADARPRPTPGSLIGVPWLGYTCGECAWCLSGRENLCPRARFTGRDIDGGMAEYAVADERFCFPIPPGFADTQAVHAPRRSSCAAVPRSSSAPSGREARTSAHPSRWRRSSSSRPWARWFPWRCAPWPPAGRWCAEEST